MVGISVPSDAQLLESRLRVPDHVVFRSFVEETVLLNINTCRYHGLNQTGGRALELLSECGELEVVAATVAEEYGAPVDRVRTDLLALCQRLARSGLIELAP